MRSILLDDTLRTKSNGMNEKVDVLDEGGNLVGHFLPTEDYYRMLCKSIDVPFSNEEMERLRIAREGCSLAEFWKKMGIT